MIWFSLSGGAAGERGGVGSVGGWFCGLLGPQREGNGWGGMIFTTTKKNALLLQDSHTYVERREALEPKARESNLFAISLSHTAMIPLGLVT